MSVVESHADGGMRTYIEDDDGEEQCPYCDRQYDKISTHWSQGSCQWPPISDYKMELLKGMMLGDGSWDKNGNRVGIAMTNLSFLEWLSNELDWLCGDVRMQMTAVEAAEGARNSFGQGTMAENCLDCYRIYTRTHPHLQRFGEWYSSGEIVFPESLSVTPTELKMWYVSDGSFQWERGEYPSIRFASQNERERPEPIVGALEGCDFKVSQSGNDFIIRSAQTPQFLDLIGEAPPGMEYKWAYESRERYNRLKEECRKEHCTQTLEEQ